MTKSKFLATTALVIFIMMASVSTNGQSYISIYKYENGTFKNKSSDEIRREEAQASANSKKAPREFIKPKKGPNSSGEFWVDGYCRYRPPASNKSRYNEAVSEIGYNRAVFPKDTIITTDDFSGNGTIPWAANLCDKSEEIMYKELQQTMAADLTDGIPFPLYNLLTTLSCYQTATERGYKKDREYEFSRSISFWVKRKSGSAKMYLQLNTEFPFTNGEDKMSMQVNDKGNFKIIHLCYNCKSPMSREVEDGKSKLWKEGDWNEITVKKDEFNTISFYINQEQICQYRIPDIPISIRFAAFRLAMPDKWEKEKLMYHIGRVTSISYPKMKGAE